MRRGGHRPDDAASGDPLAELARLIGQSDPFSDYGRRDGRSTAPREPQSQAGTEWRRQAASMPPYDSPEETPRAPSRSEPRFSEAFGGRDPYRKAEEPRDQRLEPRVDPRYDPGYEERPSQYRREPQYEDDRYGDPRQDERAYQDGRAYQDERAYDSHDAHSQPAYFDDGAPMGADDDEDYDDPPRSRRRGGLLTAVTLIGCAMIGTAGAYGYRTYYSAPNSNRVPPVITADTTPTKVVSAAEGPTGKSIKDRVGDTTERVIPREEEPVELRTPSSSSRGSGFPSASAAGTAFAPPSGNSNAGDSKRVRTLTIRPDGDQPSRDSTSRESASRESTIRESSREPTSRTANNNPPPSATPPRPAPVPKNPPSRNSAPIALDPQEPPTPPAPRERTAAVSPPATTQGLQPPAPRAPATSEGAASGYSVQLSSQRSEAEAQASYRSLQSKYPDQLSDRSVMIKRVDLGTKGVYYRALVGPFGSSDEASQLCSELKAAGGQCLIQRN
jgi:sporulation related protein